MDRFAVATLAALATLTPGCAGPAETSPAEEYWVIGDFTFVVPAGWVAQEEPDADGFNVVLPPTGDGRLLFLLIEDTQAPPITPEYAREHARRGFDIAGLPSAEIDVQQYGPDHYWAITEGEAEGRRVIAAVHVYSPGRIVVGYFHTADGNDPNEAMARRVFASVQPVDG